MLMQDIQLIFLTVGLVREECGQNVRMIIFVIPITTQSNKPRKLCRTRDMFRELSVAGSARRLNGQMNIVGREEN